jgi:hypothetical protein
MVTGSAAIRISFEAAFKGASDVARVYLVGTNIKPVGLPKPVMIGVMVPYDVSTQPMNPRTFESLGASV